MTECLAESDLKEMASAMLTDFDARLAVIPSFLCAPFFAEADRLEARLLDLYQVVARIVRKEDDLERVSKWWEMMVSVCDDFSERLGNLAQAHPECGAQAYYDKMQELKRKCHRLQTMHE
jgi:hypothetical protein